MKKSSPIDLLILITIITLATIPLTLLVAFIRPQMTAFEQWGLGLGLVVILTSMLRTQSPIMDAITTFRQNILKM